MQRRIHIVLSEHPQLRMDLQRNFFLLEKIRPCVLLIAAENRRRFIDPVQQQTVA
ncbi:MAG: hypothetical protein MPK75_07590 [Alphaproteobacteria bacterium]|nr:hypothetical protein [Alphaproteobacteria bacterium]